MAGGALIVGGTAVWIASQFIGVGEVADVAAVGWRMYTLADGTAAAISATDATIAQSLEVKRRQPC